MPHRTYIFYCSNHLAADAFTHFSDERNDDTIKTVSLPCSGKIDVPYLVKAFETGADGVVRVTCKKNECRHFEGNLRAHKRAKAVESLLEEVGMDSRRMTLVECAEQGVGQALDEIKQFIGRLRNRTQLSAQNGNVNELVYRVE